MKPIATLWVLLVAISPVFAGMWRDDFEHEGLDDWKPDTLGRGERAKWGKQSQ